MFVYHRAKMCYKPNSIGELQGAKRTSEAPWVRKVVNLLSRENSSIETLGERGGAMSPTISDVFTMTAMLDLLSSCKLVTHFSGGANNISSKDYNEHDSQTGDLFEVH